MKKQTTCGVRGCGEEHKTMADLYAHQNTTHWAICMMYRCNVPHHAHINEQSQQRCLCRNTPKIPGVALEKAMLMNAPKKTSRATQVDEEAIDHHRPFLNRKPKTRYQIAQVLDELWECLEEQGLGPGSWVRGVEFKGSKHDFLFKRMNKR